MTDLFLDDLTGDISLVNGDLKLTSDVSIVEGIRQDMKAVLRTFAGEWFLDTPGGSFGVPWFSEFFQAKPLSVDKADRIIRRVLLSIAGIASVDTIEFETDRADRSLSVTYTCTTDTGALITDNLLI